MLVAACLALGLVAGAALWRAMAPIWALPFLARENFRGRPLSTASGLAAVVAVIGAEGPSIVRTQVTNSAKVDANGLASVTLTGDPACTVTARGSANVVGCKEGRY